MLTAPKGVKPGEKPFNMADMPPTHPPRVRDVSPSPRELPESHECKEQEKITTWGALAKALGVSLRTLARWRERGDLQTKLPQPSDGCHSVEKWRAFATQHGLLDQVQRNHTANLRGDPDGEDPKPVGKMSEREMRVERESIRLKRETLEYGRLERKLILKEDAETNLQIMIGAFRAQLMALPGRASREILQRFRGKILTAIKVAAKPAMAQKMEELFDKFSGVDYIDILEILEAEIERALVALHGDVTTQIFGDEPEEAEAA